MTARQEISRVLIVDDHAVVREGLTLYLSAQPDLSVCGEASTVEEALQQVRESQPDLVVIDICLKEGNGIDLVKRVSALDPSIKMLVLSGLPVIPNADRALRAGALGYVNKQASHSEIMRAVRSILAGQTFCSPDTTQEIQPPGAQAAQPGAFKIELLSDREREVFQLIGQGVGTGAIAKRLFLSTHTIDTHRENIKRKLDLKSAGELTTAAVQWVLGQP